MRQKDGSLVYCEYNRIGIHCLSLYGGFDVYTCALNLRHGNPILAGWYEECEYICSSAPEGTKYISWTIMQKNEERLKAEEEERQEKLRNRKEGSQVAYITYDYQKMVEEFDEWLKGKNASRKVRDKFLSIKQKYTTIVGVDKETIGMNK